MNQKNAACLHAPKREVTNPSGVGRRAVWHGRTGARQTRNPEGGETFYRRTRIRAAIDLDFVSAQTAAGFWLPDGGASSQLNRGCVDVAVGELSVHSTSVEEASALRFSHNTLPILEVVRDASARIDSHLHNSFDHPLQQMPKIGRNLNVPRIACIQV